VYLPTRKPISLRLDDDAARALRVLQDAGLSRSDAIRTALVEAAARRTTKAALRREAASLAADPEDRAEMAEIAAFMDEISEHW
jgi:Arc/MetJ-type ribon-helix-helix transcriptional regulator